MNEFFGQPIGVLTKARADALYQPLNAATTLLGNTVTGSGSIVLASSPVIVTPTIAKLANLTSNGFIKTSGGDGTLGIDTSTYITGNQTITVSGDASGSGATAIALTLASVNASPNTYALATLTVNAKGLVTSASAASTTGSGNVVLATSPTIATPIIAQVIGSIASGGGLTLTSTTNGTKGKITVGVVLTIDEVNALVGIGQSTPAALLDVAGNKSFASWTTQGVNLAVEANTLTDTSGSGTIAFRTANSIGVPTLIGSSAQTLTMSVGTYFAGAPVASTNVTQTAKTAVFIDTGAAAASALILRAASTPTVKVLQVFTSANAPVASIDGAGTYFGDTTSSGDINLSTVGNGAARFAILGSAGKWEIADTVAGTVTYLQYLRSTNILTVRGASTAATTVEVMRLRHGRTSGAGQVGEGAYLATSVLNGNANEVVITRIEGTITTVTQGSEVSNLVFKVMKAGTMTEIVRVLPTSVTLAEAVNFDFGATTGTKWGTSTSQKQAWWNATPVVQQVLATGTGHTVDDVITLLQTLGLCKQS